MKSLVGVLKRSRNYRLEVLHRRMADTTNPVIPKKKRRIKL